MVGFTQLVFVSVGLGVDQCLVGLGGSVGSSSGLRSISLGLCAFRGFFAADLAQHRVDDVRIVVQRVSDLFDGVQGFWSSTDEVVDLLLSNQVSQERGDVFVSSAGQCFGFGSDAVVLDVTQANGCFVDGGDVAFEFSLRSVNSSLNCSSVFRLDGSEVLPAEHQGIVSFTGSGCFASQDQRSDLSQSFAFELQAVECIFVCQCGYKTRNRRFQGGFKYGVGHCHENVPLVGSVGRGTDMAPHIK
ncbi:hypothetical protein D3C81_1311570 [compost metagenome]